MVWRMNKGDITMHHKNGKLWLLMTILAGLNQPLFADSSDVIELLSVLKQNGVISEEQYQSLYDSQVTKIQQEQKMAVEEAKSKKKDNAPIVSFKDGGPKIESADKAYSAELHGRLQVDSAWYADDQRALGDGAEFRRAYLSVNGKIAKDFDYKLEYDFANSVVQDMYLRYNHYAPFMLTAGYFKEPFSLEELTSDLNITFMERGLPNVFAPSRKIGLMGSAYNNWGSFSLGGFGADANDNDHPETAGGEEGDEGWRVATRGTFSPIHEEGKVVHMGAAVDYWSPADRTARIRQRPESHVTDVRLVDTGSLGYIDDMTTFGAELAGVWGPLSLQGEYMQNDISRKEGGSPTFSGWYAYASYFLTGESRPYDYKTGTFGRVKPKRNFPGGPGAWELAARYSSLDLQDADVQGGKEDDITLGLNWYLNPQVKVKAEYVMIDAEPSTAYSGNDTQKGKDDSPEVYQMRVQYDF
jgi:phosphate-selective porin OprO/OprP